MSGMKKILLVMGISMMAVLVGCAGSEVREDLNEAVDAENLISENVIDGQQEEPAENVSDSQPVVLADDREIVCENPYFFPQDTSFIAAKMSWTDRYGTVSTLTEVKLYWLRQYDNGCLAKLSVMRSVMEEYMDEARMNLYFYVTSDEIYRINPYIIQDDELITFYNDDTLLMSILNTDEKLIENGELVCCPDNMEDPLEEGEIGAHASISRQDNQVTYNGLEIKQDDSPDYYENFIWEEGIGLVCYMSGYNAEAGEEEEILYLEDIMYGTADQTEDREIVCENPYFFPQDVSSMTADITYGDFFATIEGELELHWLKQYDNGCLARLSVVPFEYDRGIVYDLGVGHFNMYFYVTSEEIYHVNFFASGVDKPFDDMDAYIGHNDELVMSILNTDEMLMEHGELVFSLERIQNDVPEGEAGTWLSISQEGDQVIYSRAETSGYNIGNWEDFIWEDGLGLVRYRKAFRAERDPFYIENIVFSD